MEPRVIRSAELKYIRGDRRRHKQAGVFRCTLHQEVQRREEVHRHRSEWKTCFIDISVFLYIYFFGFP